MHNHQDSVFHHRLSLPFLGLCILCLAIACADDDSGENDAENQTNQAPNTEELPPRTAMSDGESFRVSWDGPDEPLPFQTLFALTLEIVDPDTEAPIDGLELEIDGRVANSTLSMPTEVQITDSGQGEYAAEGFLFHVPHGWELIVDIDNGTESERVRFDLAPVGRYTGELPEDPTGLFSDEALRHILTLSPAPPPPPDPTNRVADDDEAAHFGQFLFFDERFSQDGTVSCASCHLPDHGFTDPDPLSTGMETTDRRSMPVLNAAYQRWTFWDGRTDSLWAQALQPIESEVEHGISRNQLAHLIAQDPALRDAYESIFGALPELTDPSRFPEHARPIPDAPDHEHHQAWIAMSDDDRHAINDVFANFGKALAAYQRRLIRNESDFDRFVDALKAGDDNGLDVLSEEAQQGLNVFVGDGNCIDCHTGPQMTNFEFHNLGLAAPEWVPDEPDLGRSGGLAEVVDSTFSAAGPYSDAPDSEAARWLQFLRAPSFDSDGAFKTPGLRNVAERPPYMHAGHHGTLKETIDFYSDLQEDPPIGLRDPLLQQVNLESDQVSALVAFMEALTGDPLPQELTQAPDHPSP